MKLLAGLFYLVATSMTPVPESMIERHRCVPKAEISCIVDLPLVCPPGYLDGCVTRETRTHQCLSVEEGPPCDLEMTLNCPRNFIDGCVTRETAVHFCVPVRGGLCRPGRSFSCPSGFEDSCAR
jgi:hypothetical protein